MYTLLLREFVHFLLLREVLHVHLVIVGSVTCTPCYCGKCYMYTLLLWEVLLVHLLVLREVLQVHLFVLMVVLHVHLVIEGCVTCTVHLLLLREVLHVLVLVLKGVTIHVHVIPLGFVGGVTCTPLEGGVTCTPLEGVVTSCTPCCCGRCYMYTSLLREVLRVHLLLLREVLHVHLDTACRPWYLNSFSFLAQFNDI